MEAPKEPDFQGECPIIFRENLQREEYSIEDLQDQISIFVEKYGVDPSTVKLSFEEDWTGYEDCVVSLSLKGTESSISQQKRLKEYRDALDQYKKDKAIYKDWLRQDYETRRLANIEKKKAEIDSEIQDLIEKKKSLEKEPPK